MVPADPAFDRERNAWILTRYRDVAAALREPCLIPVAPPASAPAVPPDPAAHLEFRAQALRGLAPAAIFAGDLPFTRLARQRAAALPTGQTVDLVTEYARPWSLQMAALAAGVPEDQSGRLSDLARCVFQAAGDPYDAASAGPARQATAELASFFRDAPPWYLQLFVALAHSLPAFLGNAWLALLDHPAELRELRQDPSLLSAAIDELLRFAGPARAQFRQAAGPVTIGGCTIARDQQVILRLDAANHDPDEFPDPGRLRFSGRPRTHLAFGAGVHACVGAALIHSAAGAATRVLLDSFQFHGPHTAAQEEGFALRCVSSLRVEVHRDPYFVYNRA